MIGKKLMALFVFVLLAFSVPVFAQDTEDTGVGSYRAAHGKDINIIETTKDKSVDAQSRFKDARDALRDRQAEATSCKDSDTDACQETIRDYAHQQAEYLLAVRDRLHANLDLIEHFAENYILESDDKQAVLDHVKDFRNDLTTIYANIENVETIEDAKIIRDRLVEKYKTIRNVIHEYNAVTRRAKLHSIYVRMNNLYSKLNRVIEKLEDKSVNLGVEYPEKVAALKEALDNAKDNLDTARDYYRQALDAGTETDRQALIEQSRNYVNHGKDYLKNARDHLKDLVTILRNRAGNEFAVAVAQT